jgi:hypothetical protein
MAKLLDRLKQQAGVEDNPDQEGLDLLAELVVDHCTNLIDSYVAMQVDTKMIGGLIKQTFKGIK